MFNDIEKKLKITAPANLVLGLIFAFVTGKYAKFVTAIDNNGIPTDFASKSLVSGIMIALGVLVVAVSVVSFWISSAITKQKTEAFSGLGKAASTLRIIATVLLFLGGIGGVLFIFWSFFNVTSDNQLVKSVSYAVLMLVPVLVMVYSVCCFIYGLGNAADNGGDAKYVKDSKLFGMEPLHTEEDTRKICPDCGTRTDRRTCPNCGASIK